MKELLQAAAEGSLAKVKDFIENKGISVNATARMEYDFQSAVLHEAAKNLKVEIVRYLLKSGADANFAVAEEGMFSNWRPLHAVATNDSNKILAGEDIGKAEEITLLLLQHGANPTSKAVSYSEDFNGKTASDIAMMGGSYVVANTIKAFVESGNAKKLDVKPVMFSQGITLFEEYDSIERKRKSAAMPYSSSNYGLMEAIRDSSGDAVMGMVKYFDHDVNAYIMGDRAGAAYMHTPTPLSYAISLYMKNKTPERLNIVETLIGLGAYAAKSYLEDADDKIKEIVENRLLANN